MTVDDGDAEKFKELVTALRAWSAGRVDRGMLGLIRAAEKQRADAASAARNAAARRDMWIRQALNMGVSAVELADAAGVRPARIYQIRDRRR